MVRSKTYGNRYTLVDNEDYGWLRQWKWRLSSDGYAVRSQRIRGEKTLLIYMHRLVNKTPKGKLTDHKNGNRLDNRKDNLRACGHTQNMWNNNSKVKAKSGVRGVLWDEARKKWHVTLRKKGQLLHFGSYRTIQEAKRARREAELTVLGEYAPRQTKRVQ